MRYGKEAIRKAVYAIFVDKCTSSRGHYFSITPEQRSRIKREFNLATIDLTIVMSILKCIASRYGAHVVKTSRGIIFQFPRSMCDDILRNDKFDIIFDTCWESPSE